MKALHTLFTRDTNDCAGYRTKRELVESMQASSFLARRHFESIHLITCDCFYRGLRDFHRHLDDFYDSIIILSDAQFEEYLWSQWVIDVDWKEHRQFVVPKLFGIDMFRQIAGDDVFHLDIDVFLIQNPFSVWDGEGFLVQSMEDFTTHKHYYESMAKVNSMFGFDLRPAVDGQNLASYNLGVIGMSEDIDKWLAMSADLIQEISNGIDNPDWLYWNHCIEQLAFTDFVRREGHKVQCLFDYKDELQDGIEDIESGFKMVHLWGGSKRKPENVKNIRTMLNKLQDEEHSSTVESFREGRDKKSK